VLPPLTALALRRDAGRSFEAAHLVAFFGGAFLAGALLAFGAGPSLLVRRSDPTRQEMFWGSASRAALAVASGVGSVWLLVTPDLSFPMGPMWRMLAWLGGLGLPLWANALFLRLEGELTLRTLARALAIGGVSVTAALLAGVLLVLPIGGMIVPVAVGGTVYGLGMGVAAWRDVTDQGGRVRRWSEVVMVTATISVAVSLTLAARIANPPEDTLEVDGILTYDPTGQRVAFAIVRRASMLQSVGELDLDTGQWREFGRRDMQIAYAAGRRVLARRSGLSYTLDTRGAATLCRETDHGMDCGPVLAAGIGLLVRGHAREPLVVANRGGQLLAWNVEDDRQWRVDRPGSTIRWPCFAAGPSLYFRVQQGEPPYDQELLDLTDAGAEPTKLPLVHDYGCEDVGRIGRAGRFDRGRRAAAQPSRVRGPGLGEDGFTIAESVVSASWSDDGQVLGMVMQNATVRYYRPGTGVSPPLPVEGHTALALNPSGTLAAHQFHDDGVGWFTVRTVPGHEILIRDQRTDGPVLWDSAGRIVVLRAGRMIRLDPATGAGEVLFPPTQEP